MTSEELAEFVEGEIRRQRERILGVGEEQYSEVQTQMFETRALGELFEYAREEIDDIVVYALMLKIRLNRLEEQIFQGTLGWDPDSWGSEEE